MKETHSALRNLVASMVIFGTVGIFRRWIPLPSAAVAAARGVVGAAFLLALNAARRKKLSGALIRRNLALLLCSGTAMGANWIALFEAYRYTTVAAATLCYYMAPILVILASPFVIGEKLTLKKALCAAAALAGMVFVSGAAEGGLGGARGALLGLLAAALYAAVVLMNKRMQPMPALDRAVVQLLTAGVVVLPYALLTGGGAGTPDVRAVLLLAVVCIVHTGLAYALYFGSVERLPAHTLALLSYIDPVVAVLLSALLLRERLTVFTVLGAVLILSAAVLCELPERKKPEA